jgi:hypothetical protein
MIVPALTTNFTRWTATLTETRRKATINYRYQSRRDARELEDLLEAQLERFATLGIYAHSYNVVVWVTSHFSRPLNNWRLNRKQQAAIPNSFDSLVVGFRVSQTSLLPNIRDDAINAQLERTQGT